jgi:hypothetical protein
MVDKQFRLEDALMNVIESLPEEHRETFVAVLAEKDPELLANLQARQAPTFPDWRRVQDVLADAFSEHYGENHEPTETGVKIDNALGAFVTRWPSDVLGA